jgi:hypothetical protein
LALPIKRQVISVLRYDDAGDRGLGWHATFDQTWFGWCLDHASLAGPTCILGATGHQNAELRGHDVQTFADIFTNDVALSAAATGRAVRHNDLFNTRQVFWQNAAPLG